jgi:nitrogen fixation/metabolism regulation signal transduction histidine kinase
MDFSNLRTQIIVRVAALALTLFLMFQLAYGNVFSLTVILVFVLAIVQVVTLIGFLENTRNQIDRFFEAIKNNDFNLPAPKKNEGAYNMYLHHQFTMVVEKLKKSKLGRDERLQYLTTIVHHVGIGLLTFNSKGKVQIINTAARRLLKVDQLKNIDELNSIHEELVHSFRKLKTGGRELLTVEVGGDERQLSIYAIELTLGREPFKLISLQNIRSELEEKEMEAWQKLVRVLTHEIMNSVTPISSLAATVDDEIAHRLDHAQDNCTMDREDLEDIHLAVQTIKKRSEGLIRFVNDFRSLSHTPEPKFQLVQVKELFDQIGLLLKKELKENKIQFSAEIHPSDLTVNIDPELIQQVLINLIQNAIQALKEQSKRTIALRAFQDEKNNALFVLKDNGPGIDEEAQHKIFIPFFTTKKTGSGIGLSLSRQIMRQHNGTITVRSKVEEGTEFILKF